MTFYKLNTKYKDRLFRLIFKEKKELLELYNAVNGSNYTDPEELEITTMDDVEPIKQKLYTESAVYIPFPQYIVFYNGTKEMPERQELKLSDIFVGNGKGKTPALECTALVLNINLGKNKELMGRCRILKEYAQFIATVRNYMAKDMEREEAVERAVDDCIRNEILSDILRKNRNEVVEMILEEWDENEYREYLKEESWNEGHEAGIKIGRKLEMERGMRELVKTCMEFHVSREEALEKIKKAFELEQGEAEKYIEEYWK